jgi:hypothetical protein
MRLTAILVAIGAIVATAAPPLSAQSLAAVAKKEEERRKSVKSPGKVYTNSDLKADISSGTTPVPSGNASPQEPSSEVPSVNLPAGEAPDAKPKDEQYWRSRMAEARSALERSRIFGDALQSRINALNADIVNRDDPAQRTQLELERQRALAELEQVKKEIAAQTKAISDIEEEARRAGVPAGWLR